MTKKQLKKKVKELQDLTNKFALDLYFKQKIVDVSKVVGDPIVAAHTRINE